MARQESPASSPVAAPSVDWEVFRTWASLSGCLFPEKDPQALVPHAPAHTFRCVFPTIITLLKLIVCTSWRSASANWESGREMYNHGHGELGAHSHTCFSLQTRQSQTQKWKRVHLSGSKVDSAFFTSLELKAALGELCLLESLDTNNARGQTFRVSQARRCLPELFKWEEKSDKMKMQRVGVATRVPQLPVSEVSAGAGAGWGAGVGGQRSRAAEWVLSGWGALGKMMNGRLELPSAPPCRRGWKSS